MLTLDSLLAKMGNVLDFEDLLTLLTNEGEPPNKLETDAFFQADSQELLAQLGPEGPGAVGIVAEDNPAVKPGEGKGEVDKLLSAFAGINKPDEFKSQFAPLPGVAQPSRVQVQPRQNPIASAGPSAQGPLDSLNKLILGGG